ncbi:alpha/beta hydrolase [Siccirubricoccus phaeus]|uniref:alpha/beta hydrolase n=1 Tax=Siccirubricoccus phaeus TaxID=2595053 RepID=UPI0011F307B8|nr:alpha/beta hydrolase [Siccirubricoccus phaeus]
MMAPVEGSYRILRSLPYAEGNPRFTADVYVPHGAAPGGRPLIVYFYGGLWTVGTKEEPTSATLPEDLAARGAVVVVPDYRLYPEVAFPAFIQDGALAVRWAAEHAAEWGADPSRIYLAGHSTGGYMALLIGLDRRYLAEAGFGDHRLAGLIGVAGIYERWLFEHRIMRPIFGESPDRRVYLPASHLGRTPPPMLLLAGRLDVIVTPDNSEKLAEAARAAGGEVELKLYGGVGHEGILMAGPWLPSLAGTPNDIADWVRRREAMARTASR